MTARNSPCTCGSGKKYKKCCQKSFTKGVQGRIPSWIPHNAPIIPRNTDISYPVLRTVHALEAL